jgi:hypothetical protein
MVYFGLLVSTSSLYFMVLGQKVSLENGYSDSDTLWLSSSIHAKCSDNSTLEEAKTAYLCILLSHSPVSEEVLL